MWGEEESMTKLRCAECGRVYTYEVDDFCPRCGAYNQPPKTGEQTTHKDGLSESNHEGSFTHREFHQEKVERKKLRLDQPFKESVKSVKRVQEPLAGAGGRKKQQQKGPLAAVVTVIVWLVIIIQILAAFWN